MEKTVSLEKKRYYISGLILDQRVGYLRDSEGNAIHLRNKTYQVLVFLAERHNQIVSRREIAESIWKNRFVTDDSLNQCVREIRRVLGDGKKRVLKTVHCSGYMLICDIENNKDTQGNEKNVISVAV